MKKNTICIMLLIILPIVAVPALSWETYDSVIAVVNDISIIESEVNMKFNQLLKFKKVPKSRYSTEKSRILDKFIEDALILEAASEEAILVTDRKVLEQIQDLMKQFFAPKFKDKKEFDSQIAKMVNRLEKRIKDQPVLGDKELDGQIDSFIQFIETRFHIDFKEYFEEVRSQMMREQVMSIAIGVSPPSKEDAMAWYKQNRKKLGDEVWVKHILIIPSGQSFTAERNANNRLSELRKKIVAGESFEKIARANSQDPESAARGGDLGWKMLAEMDPYFAGFVNNMRTIGQVSQIFKSSFGYHIVKLMGRRQVTYDRVERLIMYKLYNESMYEQFKKWVNRRKKESDIQILMKNYVQA